MRRREGGGGQTRRVEERDSQRIKRVDERGMESTEGGKKRVPEEGNR